MKEKLVIFGIGAMTEEVVDFVTRYQLFDLIGFTVDKPYFVPSFMGLPVFPAEDLEDYIDKTTVKLFVVSSYYNNLNKVKRLKFEELKARGFHFANLISPLASVKCKDMGEGNWINDFVCLDFGTVVGDNNTFLLCSILGHNAMIGNHNLVAGQANIGGASCVGDQNFIGMCSVIFNEIKIGNKCVIGGGAIVNKQLSDFVVVVAPSSVYKQSTEKRIEYFISPTAIQVVRESNIYE